MDPEFMTKLISHKIDPKKATTAMQKAIVDITSKGELVMKFNADTTMYISIDKAVRLENVKSGLSFGISSRARCIALIHPLVRLEQEGPKIELEAIDWEGRDPNLYSRHAKITARGITFCAGVQPTNFAYLLDQAGARSTRDRFKALLCIDITVPMYAVNSRIGREYLKEASQHGMEGHYQQLENGMDKWIINGIEVTCSPMGELCVHRSDDEMYVQTWLNPQNSGTILIRNKFMHFTASTGSQAHFFVKQEDMRIHHNGRLFNVRYAAYSEALDETNQLIIL